ncbi:MAG: LytR family transcriptional regulator [Chloroflexota bacterium]|nr:MAG: LytR family transcriptional regulator [Chloroflexota bacterium]
MSRDAAPPIPDRPPAGAGIALILLLSLFIGGGLLSGWLFLANAREVIDGLSQPGRPAIINFDSIPVIVSGGRTRPTAVPGAPTQPLRPTPIPTPEDPLPIWDGKDRVTILLLGIDQRPDQRGHPTRSDTMILLTMDPLNLTAGMLSIPRDLWVPIPGYADNKINVAHFLGELEKPGLGPDLARRTIRFNIGVPIHYTARVDFQGFERLVDAIGGITIDVDRALLDNEYPSEDYGIVRVYVPVGPQHMNGLQALRFARSRHADSDFGRLRRQQQVLQAAREQTLNLGLIPKLPRMFGILSNSITTDIQFVDMLALANVGRQIASTAITSRQIDDTLVIDANGDGTILIPNRDKIRPMVQELFYDPAVKREAASVEVLNGTSRDGIATTARTALQIQSFNVTRADQAARSTYPRTVIIDNGSGKKATVSKLATALRVAPENIQTGARLASGVDITVILGADYRGVQ